MPPPCSVTAPFFSGRVGDSLDEFLVEYDELADDRQLSEQQKCETVLRYISPSHRDLWKSLDAYTDGDWSKLCHDLEGIYASTSTKGQYTRQKLYDFVQYSAKSPITEEDDVHRYYRRFLILSKPLLDSQRMTDEERDGAFWWGFHPQDRAAMTSRLIAKNPDHVEGDAYNYNDVYKVARTVFSGNQFFPLQLQNQWEVPANSKRSDAGRAMERRFGYDEEDPREYNRGRHTQEYDREHERDPPPFDYRPRDSYNRRDAEPPCTTAPSVETKIVQFTDQKRESEDREIDGLVGQMYGLSPRDRSYATLYARCAHRFPNIAATLPKPELTHEPSPPAISYAY